MRWAAALFGLLWLAVLLGLVSIFADILPGYVVPSIWFGTPPAITIVLALSYGLGGLLARNQGYHERMQDFRVWLRDMTEKPLPGGVSAAALASAMGSALLAKAVRVSLQRQDLSEEDRTALQAALDLACHQQPALLGLAEADHLLLRQLPELLDLCWPTVKPDLRVGQWLLEVGQRAGLSAAESNLRAWSGDKELVPLQARVDALKKAPEPE